MSSGGGQPQGLVLGVPSRSRVAGGSLAEKGCEEAAAFESRSQVIGNLLEAGSSGPGGIIFYGSFQSATSAQSGRPLPQVPVDSGSSMVGGVVCECGRQV